MNNPWKFLLLKIYWFSFHFNFLVFGYCLSLCFLACELPYRELERRIGAISWRIWVKKQWANHLKSYWNKKHSKLSESPKREQPPKLWTFCNSITANLLTFIAFKFCNKKHFIGSVLEASNRLPNFHLCVIILGNFTLG